MKKRPKSHTVMDFLKPYQQSMTVLSICLLLSVWSLVLLNQDLNQGQWNSSLTDSGKVLTTNSTVKRKSSNSLLWNRLTENNHLFKKDSILIGSGGSAALELNNGEKIELGEDSFFVLEPGSNLDTQLKRGALILTQNGERTLLESNADGTLSRKKLLTSLKLPEKNAQFILPDGSDTVDVEFEWTTDSENSNDFTIELSENKKFTGKRILPKEGKYILPKGSYFWRIVQGEEVVSEIRNFTVVKLLPLSLSSPAQSETITRIDFNLPIPFRWKAQKKGLITGRLDKLVIAEDKEFKKVTVENSISPTTGFTEVKLPKEGTYFWKIVSSVKDDSTVESPVQNFQLVQADNLKIQLQAPKDNTVLSKKEGILFQWDLAGVDAESTLEVTEFAAKKPVYTQTTKGTSVIWNNTATGSFLWRVSAKNGLKTISISEWRVLTLLNGIPLRLVSPAPSTSFVFWEPAPQFNFSWEKENSASEYVLDFSDSANFTKILSSQETGENEIQSSKVKLPLGKIFWRVRAIDKDKLTFSMSEARELTYDHPPLLPAPANFDPPDGTTWDVVKEGKELFVRWDAVPEAKKYEVTVSGNAISTFNTRVDSPELALRRYKSGNYTITVSAVDRMGRPGIVLGPVHLTLRYSTLKAPEAEEPEIK